MAKKRATKRKAAAAVEVKNDVEESHDEEESNAEENGVASTSKSKPGGKKKSVAKSEPKAESSKTKAKSSKAKSDSEEDEEDYEVEKIIDVNTKKNGKREFLIRWKNYSSKHDTWEPEDNLSCDELIAKFLELQEERDKQPRKELREHPKSVSRYTAQSGRKSKRTAGAQKSYTEAEDEDDA